MILFFRKRLHGCSAVIVCVSLLFGGCIHSEQKRKLSQINRKLKELERENRKLSQNLQERESRVRRSPKSSFTDYNLCGKVQSNLFFFSECLKVNRFNNSNRLNEIDIHKFESYAEGGFSCVIDFSKESKSILKMSPVFRQISLNLNQYKQILSKLKSDHERRIKNCQDAVCRDQAMVNFLTDLSKLNTGCQLNYPSIVQPI